VRRRLAHPPEAIPVHRVCAGGARGDRFAARRRGDLGDERRPQRPQLPIDLVLDFQQGGRGVGTLPRRQRGHDIGTLRSITAGHVDLPSTDDDHASQPTLLPAILRHTHVTG
jgi:hypothetical protein